ncbi:hypothetical protein F9K94_22850 [Brucella tritici]|uniref:Uncharacterized protein n=1 Tax=Brucella tritici TaxID=94626 RepID=A0A7V8B0J7_9HYPH|nr:hypothetical protein [Brucella tritici]KAB2654902.1 hypothetical protein F9K94_22850 [Brucella tritici]
MAEDIPYDAIVRAEIAIEIMNKARGLVSARVTEIEDADPAGAEALRRKRRELLAIQNGIRVGDDEHIEAVIAEWGPRVKDAARFWREL